MFLPSRAWAMSFSLDINHLHHISQYTGNIDLWPEGLILVKGNSGGCFLPVHVFKVSRFFKETWSGHLATITFGAINFLNTSDSLLAKSTGTEFHASTKRPIYNMLKLDDEEGFRKRKSVWDFFTLGKMKHFTFLKKKELSRQEVCSSFGSNGNLDDDLWFVFFSHPSSRSFGYG